MLAPARGRVERNLVDAEVGGGPSQDPARARQVRRHHVHVALDLVDPLLQCRLHRRHPHLHGGFRLILTGGPEHALGQRHEGLAHVIEALRDRTDVAVELRADVPQLVDHRGQLVAKALIEEAASLLV